MRCGDVIGATEVYIDRELRSDESAAVFDEAIHRGIREGANPWSGTMTAARSAPSVSVDLAANIRPEFFQLIREPVPEDLRAPAGQDVSRRAPFRRVIEVRDGSR